MIKISVPGSGELQLNHLVLDFNGTLACDGALIPGVAERLNRLSEKIEIHVMTADTFGTCRKACRDITATVQVLSDPVGARAKEAFVNSLDASTVAAVGNGVNDSLMLKAAVLGILVIEGEGAAVKAINSADIVVKSINDALEMLLAPKRLTATLRG